MNEAYSTSGSSPDSGRAADHDAPPASRPTSRADSERRLTACSMSAVASDDRTAESPAWVRTLRRGSIAFVVLVVAMLVLGWIGRLFVFDSALGDSEADLVGWLADNRIGTIDTVMTVGSALTDTWTVIGVVFGSVVVLLATGNRRFVGVLLIAMGLELATFVAVGEIIGRARPDVDVLHSAPSTPSFPSGHVAAAIALYGSLTLVLRVLAPARVPTTAWIAVALAALGVAASRMYEGVHYPTDVVGGALLGVGALAGARYAMGALAPDALESAAPHVPAAPQVPATPRRTGQDQV